ncbi:MAG: dihydroneopterin aldolase [Alphaproteobacteria bacterium]|nr:dihydroneopterin aldolase [Alphaproteobacteria bacterium]
MGNINIEHFARDYQIFVKNLRMSASIGIYPAERQNRQDILVSVGLSVAPELAEKLPDFVHSIDHLPSYEHVVTVIKKLVAERHIDLVESLAIEIAEHVLQDPRISSVEVRVAKPDIFADAEEVGCVLRQNRQVKS